MYQDLHEVFLFEVFHALFVLNDVDCSNTMVRLSLLILHFFRAGRYFVLLEICLHVLPQELDEFLDCLKLVGKTEYDADFAHRLMAEFDIDDSGTIDGNEFSQIMVCSVYGTCQ